MTTFEMNKDRYIYIIFNCLYSDFSRLILYFTVCSRLSRETIRCQSFNYVMANKNKWWSISPQHHDSLNTSITFHGREKGFVGVRPFAVRAFGVMTFGVKTFEVRAF